MLLFILFSLPFMIYTAEDCSSGYYVSKTYLNNTVECTPCPNGTYTELRNTIRKCLRCSSCSHDQEIKIACSASKNTECQCRQGYYKHNDMCFPCSKCGSSKVEASPCTRLYDTICKCKEGYYDKNGVCVKCSNCYLGEGVKTPCTNVTDVVCEVCIEGTFSDKISSNDTCNPYTECILGFTELNFNVTWFDTVCVNCSIPSSLLDIESFFTINFVTQRRFPQEDLKNIFRSTYNKTRNDVDYVGRDDVEGSFSYDPKLPYVMQETDYLTASSFLIDAYNKLTHLCDPKRSWMHRMNLQNPS